MISLPNVELIKQARSRTNRWHDLSPDELEAYQSIHSHLQKLGSMAQETASRYGEFNLNLTSGFNPKSGVRGSLPKDLWFSLSPKSSSLGMPQIYLIVSEKGLEYGFAPVIHPNDFSDSSYKKKIKEAAPAITASLPHINSENFISLDKALKESGEWHFRRKSRQEGHSDEFTDLIQYTTYMNKTPDSNWWGAISRYVPLHEINKEEALAGHVLYMAEIFAPYVIEIANKANSQTIDRSANIDMSLREIFTSFMHSFPIVSTKPYGTDRELWSLLSNARQKIHDAILEVDSKNSITVKHSVGKGNWAKIPWFAFLHKEETTTTESGVYGVYLFTEDMKGVYLSVAMGVTEPNKKLGRGEARNYLRQKAEDISLSFSTLEAHGFSKDPVNLKSTSNLGQDYESSCIISKYYSLDNMPPENELLDDIKALTKSYIEYVDNKDIPMNSLNDNQQESIAIRANPRRIWVIALGEKSEFFNDFYMNNQIGIGWDQIGNLSQFRTKEEIKFALENESISASDTNINACWDFINEIGVGDLVFVRRGTKKVIAAGIVTSPYKYDDNRKFYKNVRDVKWLKVGEWLPFNELTRKKQFAMQTLNEISPNTSKRIWRHKVMLDQLMRDMGLEIDLQNLEIETKADEYEDYGIDDAIEGLFLDRDEFKRILETWNSKKNIILQGPPGVGKTFIAKRLAYALIGKKNPELVSMIQFHQSYSYEDFIQGYRPTESGFVLKDGAFYSFCKEAAENPQTPYVFIIDEINRGNLSKIFGELMMLIERDKRGDSWSVRLTYGDDESEPFYVPENLYLLGMMNTADRSLSMVDYALRRRFAFIDVEPRINSDQFKAALKNNGADSSLTENLISVINALNKEISDDKVNLGNGFRIGHSYFCPIHASTKVDQNWYNQIIKTEIIPLLSEYWFDNTEKVSSWENRLLMSLK